MRLRALLVSICLLGCASEGTDFEGYPFVAVDRTAPRMVKVTVPVVLSAFDSRSPRRIVRGDGIADKPIDPKAPDTYAASKYQILFPIVTLEVENRERNLRVFAPLVTPFTFGITTVAGPAGRA